MRFDEPERNDMAMESEKVPPDDMARFFGPGQVYRIGE